MSTYTEQAEASKISTTFLIYVFDKELKDAINELIFKLDMRIDARDFTKVRPISIEVGLLPFDHGSAVFTRGRTQALASVTLGGGQDKLRVDTMMGEVTTNFMLNYNFPAFLLVKFVQVVVPGRREVGHGYLAHLRFNKYCHQKRNFLIL